MFGGNWSLVLLLSVQQVQPPVGGAYANWMDRTWDSTVAILLGEDLSGYREAYDAGHFLMIPLHAAYALHRTDWQGEFREHFNRFAARGFPTGEPRNARLGRLQYGYLASEFAVLTAVSGRPPPRTLTVLLERELRRAWVEDTAWAWGRAFPEGVRARLEWKTASGPRARAYFRAVDDVDRFVFGIAANLHRIALRSGEPDAPFVTEVLTAAAQAFSKGGRFDADSAWLFQPGVWSDHPDYAFAGRLSKQAGMSPSRVPGIAEDVSHSFRLAGLLSSLAAAYPEGDYLRTEYENMRTGLARQFVEHVLVRPSGPMQCYRTVNFMDGHNGVYRWQYKARGESWGYGPYELSGNVSLGWWALSGDAVILDAYKIMASTGCVPRGAPTGETSGTSGPRRSRARALIAGSYQNGLRKLIVLLSSMLPAQPRS